MVKHNKLSKSNEISQREIDNAKVAYSVATESMVLLENDGTLPIEPQHIALFGAGAAMNFKGGTGSGEVNERHTIGIREGLEKAGFTVSTDDWLKDYLAEVKAKKNEYKSSQKTGINIFKMDAKDMINVMSDPFVYPYGRALTEKDFADSKAKICLYVISRQAGECYDKQLDRDDMKLSSRELENLKLAREYYDKLILIVNVGGIIDLTDVDKIGVNAILHFGQQGQEGGHALADILTGKVSPSGHLTDTWIKNYDQVPFGREFSYLNGDTLHGEYKEGIYVGYRYFDSFKVEPRYPFGYGLSYTDFDLNPEMVKADGSRIKISTRVKNIGSKYSAKEVIQVYVSCPEVKLEREAQSLICYAKSPIIMPGQETVVTTSFDMRDLAAYDESSASYVLEQGDYIIRVGNNSRNTKEAAILKLDKMILISKCTNVAPNPRKNSMEQLERKGPQALRELKNDVPVVAIDSNSFETICYEYKKPPRKSSLEIDRLLKAMTIKEKVHLCTGTGILDMMGDNKFFNVPGAAAFTTSELVDKGLVNVVLADGPAGLRLNRTCGMNKRGKIKAADAMMEMMENNGGLLNKLMYADLTKDTPLYQYATAFPVGTSVAQTWNRPLIEAMGDAVGKEMEEYGVTYWLAPGMNIHRNPLCGRNYEYYSEDPVVSGKTAAAIARGVQKHEGCYVTIKHYCCNNQEFDRCTMSAYINERPLREIYLKGFKIAVREGGAKSVMTSYNMTNEVYSAESADFCMKLMRNEWGFDGVIMTDWFASWPGLANTVDGIKGGNDLHMPGGKRNWKPMLAALKDGSMKEEDLDWACANIIDSIINSRIQKEYM